MMSVSPRPVVTRVHKTWQITPGMTFSVAEDIDRQVWIVESCPAGTQFWNLSQAAMLTGGEKTGDPLEAAIALGRELQGKLLTAHASRRSHVRLGMPTGRNGVRSSEHSRSRAERNDRELIPA